MKRLHRIAAVLGMAAALAAQAGTANLGARKISLFTVGNDGVVTLSLTGGALTGAPACLTSGHLAFTGTTDTGKLMAAALEGAFLAGRLITFNIDNTNCAFSNSGLIQWFDIQ